MSIRNMINIHRTGGRTPVRGRRPRRPSSPRLKRDEGVPRGPGGPPYIRLVAVVAGRRLPIAPTIVEPASEIGSVSPPKGNTDPDAEVRTGPKASAVEITPVGVEAANRVAAEPACTVKSTSTIKIGSNEASISTVIAPTTCKRPA